MSTSYGDCLDALGDPVRRAIVERLAAGPIGLSELTCSLPVGMAAVTEHLDVLITAGLALRRADISAPVYQLDLVGLCSLRTYFDGLWNQGLEALKRAVEETTAYPTLREPELDEDEVPSVER